MAPTKVSQELLDEATAAGRALLSAADVDAQKQQLGVYRDVQTFSPVWGGSTGDGTVTHDVQEGYYWDAMGLRFINLTLRASGVSVAPSGDLRIKGLPAGNALRAAPLSLGGYNGITLPSSRVQLVGEMIAGTASIRLFGLASGLDRSLVQGSGLGAAGFIVLQGFYELA